jgi:hypothetical protein
VLCRATPPVVALMRPHPRAGTGARHYGRHFEKSFFLLRGPRFR